MIYYSKENRRDYTPPLLGNGDIAFNADCEGSVFKDGYVYSGEDAVYRAGRRASYHPLQKSPAQLLHWGSIKFDFGGSVLSFSHKLHEMDGYITSSCRYAAFEADTCMFVHQKCNLYAVSKTFNGEPGKAEVTVSFDSELARNTKSIGFDITDNTAVIDLYVAAYDRYRTRIALTANKPSKITRKNNTLTFRFNIKDGDRLCFYYCIEDDLYCKNYKGKIQKILTDVKEKGFDALLAENIKIWNKYHESGYIKTDSVLTNSVYGTAMYTLKCLTTRWSVPVSLNNMGWSGKFFAFDEYYSYLALLQSGKTELAERVPNFRSNVCLKPALERATDYGKNPDTAHARFMWETGERGEELSPPGFWHDHIFHMAVIALGAFEFYEYSGDTEHLKTFYPMIKACAKFYTLNSVYRNSDGNLYVGKCTDMERLGANITNPFFTACGVIKTLEVLAASAKILNCDSDYAKECRNTAELLRQALPNDGEKYIPHSGCKQKSIAVFGGKYPFDTIANDDEKLLPTLDDFSANEGAYGNMYPLGNGVSMWYSVWKSVAFARMKMTDRAFSNFERAVRSAGPFGEVFELNEGDMIKCPYFTTAAGVLSSALCEMLLQSDGENIYLLPAYPAENRNVSFRLAAKGGASVEAEIKNGELKKLKITAKSGKRNFNVYFRGKLIDAKNGAV